MDAMDRNGAGGPPGVARRPPRVLLVEDNAVNALLVVATLQGVCDVHVVDGGERVLSAVVAERYVLMLLDFHLHGMSGLDVTQEVRAREAREGTPRLPIVMLTASTDRREQEACLRAGADAVMLKPFGVLELRNLVQQHLRSAPPSTAA